MLQVSVLVECLFAALCSPEAKGSTLTSMFSCRYRSILLNIVLMNNRERYLSSKHLFDAEVLLAPSSHDNGKDPHHGLRILG